MNCPGQVTASLSPPSLPLYLSLCCVSLRDPCSVLFLNERMRQYTSPTAFSHLLLPRFTTVGSPRFNSNVSPRFDPNGSQRITTCYHKRDATFRLVSPHSRFDPGRPRSTHPRSAVLLLLLLLRPRASFALRLSRLNLCVFFSRRRVVTRRGGGGGSGGVLYV